MTGHETPLASGTAYPSIAQNMAQNMAQNIAENFAHTFAQTAAPLKVAVVHDWMFVRRGGERVLEQILSLVPHADVFYLFGNPEQVLQTSAKHRFFGSFLAGVPFIEKCYKMFLPLLPVAAESFDLSAYNLVLSSSSCVAKGIVPSPLATHVTYVHSPMRYAWDQEHRYFTKPPTLYRPLELLRRVLLSRLRVWDVSASLRCHRILTNSVFVAQRCALYYGRQSHVVNPGVDVERFYSIVRMPSAAKKVLLFGAWVPYKGMAEALELCVRNGIHVVAAGQGKSLEQVAERYSKNPRVEICRTPTEQQVAELFARCHVLLFPGIEDFGIVPVEAQAAGMWVVAPAQGGTGETVIDHVTGFHFEANNSVSMLEALQKALAQELTPENIGQLRTHAQKFSREAFLNAYSRQVLEALNQNNLKKHINRDLGRDLTRDFSSETKHAAPHDGRVHGATQ